MKSMFKPQKLVKVTRMGAWGDVDFGPMPVANSEKKEANENVNVSEAKASVAPTEKGTVALSPLPVVKITQSKDSENSQNEAPEGSNANAVGNENPIVTTRQTSRDRQLSPKSRSKVKIRQLLEQ